MGPQRGYFSRGDLHTDTFVHLVTIGANIHVVPQNDTWAVKREGGAALLSDLSEDEAIDAGREIARCERVRFEIYDADGRIRESYAYDQLGRDTIP